MTFAQLSLYCVAMFVLVLHLLLPLLERAAVAQLDGPAVVDGVVGSVHGAAAAAAAAAPVALVVFSFCLAARPARRRRRLAARPPDAVPPCYLQQSYCRNSNRQGERENVHVSTAKALVNVVTVDIEIEFVFHLICPTP